jgi:hypothetical protein
MPDRTRSLISRATETIPRIFRIMNTSAVTARTVQGMARVRSGQAPACPLVSDRSVRRGSRVKRDLACTFARHLQPVLTVLWSQSRLMLEGRTRTLSGPCPDRSRARTSVPATRAPTAVPLQRPLSRAARCAGVRAICKDLADLSGLGCKKSSTGDCDASTPYSAATSVR